MVIAIWNKWWYSPGYCCCCSTDCTFLQQLLFLFTQVASFCKHHVLAGVRNLSNLGGSQEVSGSFSIGLQTRCCCSNDWSYQGFQCQSIWQHWISSEIFWLWPLKWEPCWLHFFLNFKTMLIWRLLAQIFLHEAELTTMQAFPGRNLTIVFLETISDKDATAISGNLFPCSTAIIAFLLPYLEFHHHTLWNYYLCYMVLGENHLFFQ